MFRSLIEKFRRYCERNEIAHAAVRNGVSEGSSRKYSILPLPAQIAEELDAALDGKLYVIELQNDDITPMDYVVQVVQMFSGKDRYQAVQLMLKIHEEGTGQLIAGSKDTLDKIARHIEEDARDRKFPFKCKVRSA
ncbi:MAG: ATP-dependent Clp protease adaptor ClpS [Pseudomonadota bacterium]